VWFLRLFLVPYYVAKLGYLRVRLALLRDE
jgi:hypothetical protein